MIHDRSLQNTIINGCLLMVSIVASAWTVHALEGMMAAEQIEICHRSGSLDCPPLPR